MSDANSVRVPGNLPLQTSQPGGVEASWEALTAFARADFGCFVDLMFPVLHPGQKLVYADYLGLIASLLMGVGNGNYKRVIINLPPRHMKSMLTSVLYPAWRLGRDPTAKFICISYADALAHDLSALTRTVMLSPLYQRIFPHTSLNKTAVDYVRTTVGGYRYTTSVGSDITGFGADEIIIDDPIQPEEASSERAKQHLRDWVSSSVLTRFNDPTSGTLILVMHRLAPDDLSQTLEPTADFVLKLPLVAEEREEFGEEGTDRVLFRREPGEPLNPTRMGRKYAENLKAELAPHVFAAQYQQRPTAGGSGMLSIDKWRRYDPAKRPAFELVMHSWDIGATRNGNASVCTVWGLARNEERRDALYLVNVARLRLELPDVRQAIKALDKRDRPALIVLDDSGIGLGVYQDLWNQGYRHIVGTDKTHDPLEREGSPGMRPNLSKIDRFGRAALHIADGRVYLPTHAPWLDAFVYEIASFPNITDKDQVDSMSQLVGRMDRAIWRARTNKASL